MQNREKVSVSGRYRNAEGEYRILETEAHPRFACDGTFMGLTGVNIDVTERQRADAQRQLLLAELNHRVKNTLAVVQGLAHQTFRRTDATARKSFEGRLLALAAAHDLLTRSNWESASLHQVAVDTLQIRDGERQRISISGSPVRLEPRAALSIALALHELLTNAMKYGSLSDDAGTVTLDWREQTDGQIRITWQEFGGPPVTPPQHLGFGSLLLEKTLAIDLKGKVTAKFEPGGVVCVIDMPLSSEGTSSCHA